MLKCALRSSLSFCVASKSSGRKEQSLVELDKIPSAGVGDSETSIKQKHHMGFYIFTQKDYSDFGVESKLGPNKLQVSKQGKLLHHSRLGLAGAVKTSWREVDFINMQKIPASGFTHVQYQDVEGADDIQVCLWQGMAKWTHLPSS